jgi:hypothetical protein
MGDLGRVIAYVTIVRFRQNKRRGKVRFVSEVQLEVVVKNS